MLNRPRLNMIKMQVSPLAETLMIATLNPAIHCKRLQSESFFKAKLVDHFPKKKTLKNFINTK